MRRDHILAFVAALGVLLHAGLAAAQVFCAMTGTITTSCCCPEGEASEGPAIRSADDCCRQALEAPSFDLHQQQQPLAAPGLAPAWAQVLPPEPPALPATDQAAPASTSPPLAALQTIILIR